MRFLQHLIRAAALSSTVTLAALATGAHARTYTVLHSFDGDGGADPVAGLTLDGAGNLYGTTTEGGKANAGVIFRIAPDGTYTVLHSFDGGAEGAAPRAGVVVDKSTGDLYGTTSIYGYFGNGTIYKLSADGSFAVLHDFDGIHDGGYPIGTLVRDKLGNLYGVAQLDGAYHDGTVYRLGADGAFTVLHAFAGSDGANPAGRLERDRAGNLYGVMQSGGAADRGALYRLKPNGRFKTLYSFTGGADGEWPTGGLVRDKAENLYGTTGETAFQLTPDGTFTVLHSFSPDDGADPNGDLLHIGKKLYGTTSSGGCCADYGTVFRIGPDGAFAVLHDFAGGDDGAVSYAGLAKGPRGSQTLYGTTEFGGAYLDGTVFSVTTK